MKDLNDLWVPIATLCGAALGMAGALIASQKSFRSTLLTPHIDRQFNALADLLTETANVRRLNSDEYDHPESYNAFDSAFMRVRLTAPEEMLRAITDLDAAVGRLRRTGQQASTFRNFMNRLNREVYEEAGEEDAADYALGGLRPLRDGTGTEDVARHRLEQYSSHHQERYDDGLSAELIDEVVEGARTDSAVRRERREMLKQLDDTHEKLIESIRTWVNNGPANR
ncbi:hypothetical protein [Streptomyces sp. NPDC004296]|uniref:hypothetical protein n=1 Tax=Streptomyces sp. NPDC004296 TaxID=3364697 RepID=UPI003674F2B1